MSEIQRRRKKFIQQIKRQNKQQYFKMRRQLLLHQQNICNSRLRYFLKKSLANNGLSQQIQAVIHQLFQSIQNADNFHSQYQYIIAICSNILIDDLSLEHKEALANILYQVYKRLQYEIINQNNKVIYNISYSLPNFVIVLPCLKEDFASDCESLAYKLSIQIIKSIIDCDFAQGLKTIADGVIQAWINLITYEPQYKPQLQINFRLNITFYQQFVKLHSQLFKYQKKQHCLIIRKGLLKIFQILTLQIDLTQYSMIFQAESFITFVIRQLIDGNDISMQKMGLNILISLFIDYEKIDQGLMLQQMQRAFKERIELIFKNLLLNDGNIEYRMKLLKITLSIPKYYEHFQHFFQHYWKEIIDHCIATMRNQSNLALTRFSIQILLLLKEHLSSFRLLNHLRNVGAQSFFDHFLIEFEGIQDQQVKQEIELMSSQLSYLLDMLKAE